MTTEIIESNSICDYCKRKYDFDGRGNSCWRWYGNMGVCRDAEDFQGYELILVETK